MRMRWSALWALLFILFNSFHAWASNSCTKIFPDVQPAGVSTYTTKFVNALFSLKSAPPAEAVESLAVQGMSLHTQDYRLLHDGVLRLMAIQPVHERQVEILESKWKLSRAQALVLLNFVSHIDEMASHRAKAIPETLYPLLHIGSAVHGVNLTPTQRLILEKFVVPAIRDRTRYLRVLPSSEPDTLRVASPVGVYHFNYKGDPKDVERSPAHVEIIKEAGGERSIEGFVGIGVSSLNAKGRVRQVVRADPYLHPNIMPPSLVGLKLPSVLNEYQESVVDQLVKLDVRLHEEQTGGLIRLGVMMPTATGKSLIAAHYIRKVQEIVSAQRGSQTNAVIVVVVEDIEILKGLGKTLARELGIRDEEVLNLYNESRNASLSSQTRLVLTTRSSYMTRWSTFEHLYNREHARGRPIIPVLDEGHHVGRENGEFRRIINHMDQKLTAKDRMLFLSATMWHPETNLIRDVLHGNLVAPFLDSLQLAKLRLGEDPEDYARVQFFRAIIEGYLSPFAEDSVEVVKIVGDAKAHDLIKRSHGVERKLPQAVYEDAAKRILSRPILGVADRGVFFETGITRAQGVRDHMATALKRDIRTLTSDTKERGEVMDWFKDHGDGLNPQHKYLSSVNILLEGVDVPELNYLIIMRNIKSMRVLMQILGRGARVAAFTPYLRVLDYSGTLAHFFEDGAIWDEVHVKPSRYVGPAFPKVDDRKVIAVEEISNVGFQGQIVPAYMSILEHVEKEAIPQVTTEQMQVFRAQGMPVLKREFPHYFGSSLNVHGLLQEMGGHLPAHVYPKEAMGILLSDKSTNAGTLLLQGVSLIARAFNSLPQRDRLGLAEISLEKVGTRFETERLLAGLVPFYMPTHLVSTKEIKSFEWLSGTSEVAPQLMDLISSRLISRRSGSLRQMHEHFGMLVGAVPENHRRKLIKHLRDKRVTDDTEVVSARYVYLFSYLLNWHNKVHDRFLAKPLNLNSFFGLAPNVDYLEASFLRINELGRKQVKTAIEDLYVKQLEHWDLETKNQLQLDEQVVAEPYALTSEQHKQFISNSGAYKVVKRILNEKGERFRWKSVEDARLALNVLAEAFPENVKSSVRESLVQLTPTKNEKLEEFTLRALVVVAKYWNALPTVDRYGLPRVELSLVDRADEMQLLLNGLVPFMNLAEQFADRAAMYAANRYMAQESLTKESWFHDSALSLDLRVKHYASDAKMRSLLKSLPERWHDDVRELYKKASRQPGSLHQIVNYLEALIVNYQIAHSDRRQSESPLDLSQAWARLPVIDTRPTDFVKSKAAVVSPTPAQPQLPREERLSSLDKFKAPGGGLAMLKLEFPDQFLGTGINVRSLVEQWTRPLPESVRPNGELQSILASQHLSDEQKLLTVLQELARFYNQLNPAERYGLAKVDLARVGERNQLERLLSGLIPYRFPMFLFDGSRLDLAIEDLFVELSAEHAIAQLIASVREPYFSEVKKRFKDFPTVDPQIRKYRLFYLAAYIEYFSLRHLNRENPKGTFFLEKFFEAFSTGKHVAVSISAYDLTSSVGDYQDQIFENNMRRWERETRAQRDFDESIASQTFAPSQDQMTDFLRSGGILDELIAIALRRNDRADDLQWRSELNLQRVMRMLTHRPPPQAKDELEQIRKEYGSDLPQLIYRTAFTLAKFKNAGGARVRLGFPQIDPYLSSRGDHVTVHMLLASLYPSYISRHLVQLAKAPTSQLKLTAEQMFREQYGNSTKKVKKWFHGLSEMLPQESSPFTGIGDIFAQVKDDAYAMIILALYQGSLAQNRNLRENYFGVRYRPADIGKYWGLIPVIDYRPTDYSDIFENPKGNFEVVEAPVSQSPESKETGFSSQLTKQDKINYFFSHVPAYFWQALTAASLLPANQSGESQPEFRLASTSLILGLEYTSELAQMLRDPDVREMLMERLERIPVQEGSPATRTIFDGNYFEKFTQSTEANGFPKPQPSAIFEFSKFSKQVARAFVYYRKKGYGPSKVVDLLADKIDNINPTTLSSVKTFPRTFTDMMTYMNIEMVLLTKSASGYVPALLKQASAEAYVEKLVTMLSVDQETDDPLVRSYLARFFITLAFARSPHEGNVKHIIERAE